jgi:hypothetical protein
VQHSIFCLGRCSGDIRCRFDEERFVKVSELVGENLPCEISKVESKWNILPELWLLYSRTREKAPCMDQVRKVVSDCCRVAADASQQAG